MRTRLADRLGHATRLALVAAALAALPTVRAGAAPDGPAVGASATYRWTSTRTQEAPVLVQEPGGRVTLGREPQAPQPLFVTYAIVQEDARSYVLQVVTHLTLDGAPLSVTQVTVDRASGKALRSVIRRPKGLIATPEDGLRPFRQAAVKGVEEAVTVAAGRFTAVRAPYRDGTVWVSDQVPALGLARATFPNGTLELVRSGTSGAKDLLRS